MANFRVICLVMICVESFLGDAEGSLNQNFKFVFVRLGGECLINVIHCRYHYGKVRF